MMFDKIVTRLHAAREEKAKLEANIEKLNGQLSALDAKRERAIDKGDSKAVADLTRDRLDLQLQIEAQQSIIDRKEKTNAISRDEMREAWNHDMADRQADIDKAQTEFVQLLEQALEKALDVSRLAISAWDAREAALTIAGDDRPFRCTVRNIDFNSPEYNSDPMQQFFRMQYIKETYTGRFEDYIEGIRPRLDW